MHGQDFSDLWVPKIVKGRLIQSMRIVNATAGPTGPAGYGATLPRELIEVSRRRQSDGKSEWWEYTDEGPTIVRRFSAARITQAEEEVIWPYRYLKDEPPPRGSDLQPLEVLNAYLFCKQSRGVTFEKACR